MNNRIKATLSLTVLVLLGVTIATDAAASPDGIPARTTAQIQSCVSEIGKHADYADASRVIHWVATLDQRNLVEMEIRIETAVYLGSDRSASRSYASSCVTDIMGDIVRFRIDPLAPESRREG